jgi:hypothetical protein
MAQETSLGSIVPSSTQEGTTLKVDKKTKQVVYSSEEPISQRLIAQVGFNKKSGVLNFVRNNGEILTVTGFLTASQFGRGVRGLKGKPGTGGKLGRTGRDAKIGKAGCEGQVGPKGIIGIKGLDGEDGEVGIIGYFGCPGIPGYEGSFGIVGIDGNEGPIGKSGPSCIAGPVGLIGPQPKENVFYGSTAPPEDFFLWAIPYTLGQVEEPLPVVADMTGSVNSSSSLLTLVVANTYGGALVLRLSLFKGGTGPWTYKWTDVDSVFSDPALTVGNTGTTGTSLELKALQNIAIGNTATISGKVNFEARDSLGKFFRINNIDFSFTGTNTQIAPATGGGGGGGVVVGGGGGGCILGSTPVYLYDGTVIKAKDIQIGDYLSGYSIPGMVDENVEGWQNWTTESTEGKVVAVVVRNALKSWYTGYWLINDDIGITVEHELFVKKENTWGWHCADTIKVGDYLLDIDNKSVPVETIVFNKIDSQVVVLDVENVDTYFVGHSKILVHNLGPVTEKF